MSQTDTCLIHGMPMRYDFRSGLDICDMCEAVEQNGDPCPDCGGALCEHGICEESYCGEDERCMVCYRKQELAREAEAEFKYQRDVIGPMFGFKDEEESAGEAGKRREAGRE